MVLAEPQGWALQLLDDGVIEVAILLPQLQELDMGRTRLCQGETATPSPCPLPSPPLSSTTYPGDLLLLVLLHGQEAGAVDGHHDLL